MPIDRAAMAFAGVLALPSPALSRLRPPFWLLFTAFVGLTLMPTTFTGFYLAARLFKRLGLRPHPTLL